MECSKRRSTFSRFTPCNVQSGGLHNDVFPIFQSDRSMNNSYRSSKFDWDIAEWRRVLRFIFDPIWF